ncbi:MAG TPA: GNAT family N-acetyltransferase [Armatimonadota bacterium]|nr:GNAT family N-acetyltransferase [Armatimonadota bacterium]
MAKKPPALDGRTTESELELAFQEEAGGPTRLDLKLKGKSVSHLWIIPFKIRIGAATVPMGGIGDVWTDKACRNRGYARRMLDAAVTRMEQGAAALSMLYGIRDFYPKFGYATAGADHFITLEEIEDDASLPEGWQARALAQEDLPAVRNLYDRSIRAGVGAAERPPHGSAWSRLEAAAGDATAARVILNPEGVLSAYAWEGKDAWYHGEIAKREPDALALSEALAEGPAAADALLAACRIWAMERSEGRKRSIKRVVIAQPPEGPVAAAAMRQAATFSRRFDPCGSSMVRALNVERLLEALLPELNVRLQRARYPLSGVLHFQTDIGEARLRSLNGTIKPLNPRDPDAPKGPVYPVRLPQYELGRLALGAFPPGDLLARLENPPAPETCEILRILFPERNPHMYLQDRF